MSLKITIKNSEIPEELLEFKIVHYKEIFHEEWEKVFNANPSLDAKEKLIILKDLDKIVGGCVIRKGIYSLKFKDFSILPGNRGKGYARILMKTLEEIAIKHHQTLLNTGAKPSDIKMMYLRSIIYLDSTNPEEANVPALQFAQFLRNCGFTPYLPNMNAYPYDVHEFSKEEKVAFDIYRKLYPSLVENLRVFKKLVLDDGVELSDKIKEELLHLRDRPDKWKIVMGGLNWKLGHYQKSGEVSYKYDICPICKDLGVSNVSTDNEMAKSPKPCPADNCYIYLTCMEPFRKHGFFKEDNEVSGTYFEAMRTFMLSNSPEGK